MPGIPGSPGSRMPFAFRSYQTVPESSWVPLTSPAFRVTVAAGATSNVSVVPVPGSTSLPEPDGVNTYGAYRLGGANLR